MNTRQTLVLKALQFKALHTGYNNSSLIDAMLEDNPERADELTKNVCARIPRELAERMEELGGLLKINKREMITMALNDFLIHARDVIDEFQAWPAESEEG
jgi:predicted transcriptional regulator